jgi:hypothetical protein
VGEEVTAAVRTRLDWAVTRPTVAAAGPAAPWGREAAVAASSWPQAEGVVESIPAPEVSSNREVEEAKV